MESGLEYARECLTAHDSALGRTTHKNKTWAETMDGDIRHMKRTLAMLRSCGPNSVVSANSVEVLTPEPPRKDKSNE